MERRAWKRVRATRVCSLAATVLAAIAAAPAAAAPTWMPPHDLSGTQTKSCIQMDPTDPSSQYICPFTALFPRLDLGPDGEVLPVWNAGTSSTNVMGTSRPSGGTFASAFEIAAPAAGGARVGIDGSGNAIAAWTRSGGGNVVEAAFRPTGGTFGGTSTVATSPAILQDLDVAPNGAALATVTSGSPSRVGVSYRPPGGAFGPVEPVSEPNNDIRNVQAAIDATGDAVIVWMRPVAVDKFWPEVAFRPAAGPPGDEILLDDVKAQTVDVAMNGAGDAAVMWFADDFVPRIRRRPAGGSLAATDTPLNSAVGGIEVAVDEAGSVFATWSRQEGSSPVTEWTIRPPGGSFSTPVLLTGANGGLPDVEFWPNGDALAVWASNPSGSVLSASRPEGGSFGGALSVFGSGNQHFPIELALDPAGNAGVTVLEAYGNGPTTSDRAWVVGYDGAPPVISGISVPSSARPGQALDFGASAADVWSSTGPVEWDFGDGATATGTAVEHAYASVGEYEVTISATDGLDQTATLTRTIDISVDGPDDGPDGGPDDGPDEGPDDGSESGAPTIRKFRLTNDVFRVGRKKTPVNVAGRVPRGTKFKFRSSEAGRAVIAIHKGKRKRGGGTRWVLRRPKLKRDVNQGRNRIRFTGRYGKRVLRPGRYRATLRVKDADGNRSSRKRARFKIVR